MVNEFDLCRAATVSRTELGLKRPGRLANDICAMSPPANSLALHLWLKKPSMDNVQ